jgi:spore germination protein YaaH
MRDKPPRDEPPRRPLRRDLPRPEGPFERLLKQRPERDPAPIIIGGTIAFLAIVIILVFVFSSVLSGGGNGGDSGQTIQVADGVSGRLTSMPGLPPGLAAASQYIEFETNEAIPVTIALPLTVDVSGDAILGFYSHLDGRWQRIAESQVMPSQEFASQGCLGSSTTTGSGLVSCGDFSAVPRNLAVLQVLAQTYTVAASLPAGATLHSDARPNIVSPRDFSPASDGSVVGSATTVDTSGSVQLMPTIVGSSTDTAAVVDDILADESLRSLHVQQIVTLVEDGGFDGVDLEYSAVDAALGSQFTAFVSALADALGQSGHRLSLTLPPPGDQRSAYDWKRLGELVDYIKVLPFADPVAYWDNMPDGIAALTQDVAPQKILLVVNPFSIETGDVARAIGYQNAMLLASRAVVREPDNPDDIVSGATVRLVAESLDEAEGASPMAWDDRAAAVAFSIGGTDRRRIYIENSYSVGFKLELVQAYGLGGVAVSDASAQSDVANVWGRVNELVITSTVSLRRPSETMLVPIWQAPGGGDLGAGAGTSATWIAPSAGTYALVLVVSDGDRRFGQEISVVVNESDEPSPSPLATFAPDTDTPTPAPTDEPANQRVEVGVVAEGNDDGGSFSNDETVTPGSTVTYLVTFDNDFDVPVTITDFEDIFNGPVTCLSEGGGDIIGLVIPPDDGDAPDGPDVLDGGADEVQCLYDVTAPLEPKPDGEPYVIAVRGTVKDPESGASGFGDDSANIYVVLAE